jgi:hypothetical protein
MAQHRRRKGPRLKAQPCLRRHLATLLRRHHRTVQRFRRQLRLRLRTARNQPPPRLPRTVRQLQLRRQPTQRRRQMPMLLLRQRHPGRPTQLLLPPLPLCQLRPLLLLHRPPRLLQPHRQRRAPRLLQRQRRRLRLPPTQLRPSRLLMLLHLSHLQMLHLQLRLPKQLHQLWTLRQPRLLLLRQMRLPPNSLRLRRALTEHVD